jgi:dipeptidase E
VKLLLISSSLVHGYGYLEQPEPDIKRHFAGAKRIAFVPFAAFDHAAYTAKVSARFAQIGFEIIPIEQLDRADGIFAGGGNAFRLLEKLYARDLLDPIRQRVRSGLPYIGSSAGSVVTCPTIRTTNDMPIVECKSLDAFGLIPFQLNCHYLDADPSSTHKGETREERIREFHEENTTPVVGLREGTMLLVQDNSYKLLGNKPARIFRSGQEPVEVGPGTRLDEYVR